jgi:hypothetical protein
MDTSPEVTVSFQPAGRETYAAIVGEHRREMPDIEIVTDEDEDGLTDEEWLASLEIEQVHSFLIHAPIQDFEAPAERFQLVEKRLLAKMPGPTRDSVTRIEFTREDEDKVTVRVWRAVEGA